MIERATAARLKAPSVQSPGAEIVTSSARRSCDGAGAPLRSRPGRSVTLKSPLRAERLGELDQDCVATRCVPSATTRALRSQIDRPAAELRAEAPHAISPFPLCLRANLCVATPRRHAPMGGLGCVCGVVGSAVVSLHASLPWFCCGPFAFVVSVWATWVTHNGVWPRLEDAGTVVGARAIW